MMELVDMPGMSAKFRICRMRTAKVKTVGGTLNGDFCASKLGGGQIPVGDVFCMRGGAIRKKGPRKCPVNLGVLEDIWFKTGGAMLQFHTTKISVQHFDKNAYSRMNVSLAAQVLSGSVATMVRDAIRDRAVKLQIKNKNMYNHLADLCDNWNTFFDITNGKDGPHTPTNAKERQQKLLATLKWFSI